MLSKKLRQVSRAGFEFCRPGGQKLRISSYQDQKKKKRLDKPAGTTSEGQQMDRQIKPTSLNWDETVCGHTLFMWQGVHIMFAMAAHKTVAFS